MSQTITAVVTVTGNTEKVLAGQLREPNDPGWNGAQVEIPVGGGTCTIIVKQDKEPKGTLCINSKWGVPQVFDVSVTVDNVEPIKAGLHVREATPWVESVTLPPAAGGNTVTRTVDSIATPKLAFMLKDADSV
jgi:hypothetical protein